MQEEEKEEVKRKQRIQEHTACQLVQQRTLLNQFYLFILAKQQQLKHLTLKFIHDNHYLTAALEQIQQFRLLLAVGALPHFSLFISHLNSFEPLNLAMKEQFSLRFEAQIAQLAALHGFTLARSADNTTLELTGDVDRTDKIRFKITQQGLRLEGPSNSTCLPLLEELIHHLTVQQKLRLDEMTNHANLEIGHFQKKLPQPELQQYLKAQGIKSPHLTPY